MKFCLIAAIFGCAAAADVSLDTEKLTDFTAEFEASVKNLPVWGGQSELLDGQILGKVQLNLLAEKLKFSYGIMQQRFDGLEWQGNTDSPSGPPYYVPWKKILSSGAMTKGSGEIVIDGPAGVATITQQAKAITSADGLSFEMDMNYCFHVKLPANFAPPGGMLKQQADQAFPSLEQEMNELPHTQTANGDLVYSTSSRDDPYYAENHYPDAENIITIKTDGSPVSWHMKSTCEGLCMQRFNQYESPEVNLTVNSFTAGAGEVTPLSCIDSSVADLSEQPGIMHAAVVFDTFMQQFAKNSGMNLPSLQPLIEQQIFLAKNVSNPGAQQQSWMVALLAGVAGMAGGAVVLALDKASRGQGSHHPLLSEA